MMFSGRFSEFSEAKYLSVPNCGRNRIVEGGVATWCVVCIVKTRGFLDWVAFVD